MVQSLLAQGKIMRASEVKRGMVGYALSVFQGTKIEKFPVEVLGNLQKGRSGEDLVLIKVTGGPVVTRNSGIIQGMSGSPVYFNGKMLGAIAIGFSFPKEPIGGVTPITQMIETALPDTSAPKLVPLTARADETYRPSQPLKVAGHDVTKVVVSRDSKRVALDGETMTMRPCTQYVELSGISESSLPRWKKMLEPMGVTPVLGGGAMTPQQFTQVFGLPSQKMGVVAPFVPGAAIGVQLVSGDMDMTGVGTITFRSGKRVLAFGHPMFGLGAVSMPMTTAYVHDIYPAYDISFKLASPIATVGALQQDTAFAIGGTVGRQADTVPMQVFLRDDERHISKNYRVRIIKDPTYTPQLVLNIAAEAISDTLGAESDKMLSLGLKIQLANGTAIYRKNLVYAADQVLMGGVSDLMDALSLTQLNSFEKGNLKSVDVSVQVAPQRKTARIRRIYADRNRVKAGETVHLSVELEPHGSGGKTFTRSFDVPVDKDAPNGILRVVAAPAASYWIARARAGGAPPQVQSLQELLQAYGRIGASNELSLQASTPNNFLVVDRTKVPNPPVTWARLAPPGPSTAIAAYNEVNEQRQSLEYSLAGLASISIPIESLRDSDRKRPEAPAAEAPAPGVPQTPTTVAGNAVGVDPDDSDAGDDGTSVWVGTGDWDQNFGFTAADRQVLPTLEERATRVRRMVAVALAQQKAELKATAVPTPTPAATATPAPTATPGPTPTPTPDPTAGAIARPVGHWIQQTAADFSRGTLVGTVVTDDGRLIAGSQWERLVSTAEPVAWSVARDAAGNTYLGTGHRARLFKVAPDGTVTTMYDGPEVAVEALTVDAKGNVYAGISPGGRVLRFKPGSTEPEVILQTEDVFVHALDLDEDGNLLVATGGSKGAVYRIPQASTAVRSDERVEPLTTVGQEHILSLSVNNGVIYAGTGDEAVLYRIDEKTGAATALYQVIPAAVATPAGAPNPGAGDAALQNALLTGGAAANGNTAVLLTPVDGRMGDPGQVAVGAGNGITGIATDSGAVYFGTAGSGSVYRWTADHGVEELFRTPGRNVFALRAAPDGLYTAVGSAAGNRGELWEIHPAAVATESRGSLLLDAPQAQVTALGDGVAATANNAAIYAPAKAASPAFTSNIFDAGQLVRWGVVRVSGQNGPVQVPLATRSGNTREPDATWSSWTPVSAAESPQVTSPAARYLQYRVVFDSPKAQPDVSRVEILYRAPNRAPAVRWTSPVGGEYISGKRNITWAASDPDKDPLRFRVTLARDGDKPQPVELKTSTAATFELDTSKYPDGNYRLTVQASDAARNPEEPLQDEARGEVFTIDNTPPVLSEPTGVKADDGWVLKLDATDATSPLAGAEWRVLLPEIKKESKPATPSTEKTDGTDGAAALPALKEVKPAPPKPEWQAAAAADGIFDSRTEGIVARLDPALLFTPGLKLESGTRVELRVRDSAGNSSVIMTTLP